MEKEYLKKRFVDFNEWRKTKQGYIVLNLSWSVVMAAVIAILFLTGFQKIGWTSVIVKIFVESLRWTATHPKVFPKIVRYFRKIFKSTKT